MADNKVEIQVQANVAGTDDIINLGKKVDALGPAGQAAATGANSAASGFAKLGETALSLNQAKELIGSLVSTLGGVPAEVLKTADAYNNLAARVQLVTGSGPAFQTAFNGISEVALRTSSNLDSTGQLFTKLAEAGKTMGIGQAEALKLTETVNQAIQLSGASAQASDAAIVQLVQGLQGGALRGDEFNSVMEQSPRLAKALADGLGTTTGELRKMAEAGQLTSDVVIKSLQGQSDAVASEFAKLPPTVGRALENLSTNWTLYVGETDKATGASKAAATVISALASNISTIAGFLIDAGQAAAAFAALKLAQHFAGIATAATSSATAVVANTTAITAAGTASTAAATTVGKFASVLSGLKTFTLLGLITNFQDIGVAIGEAAAKLMGYKDRTNELAAAEKVAATIAADNVAQRLRMAAATQAIIDKQFELSKSATDTIAEFDKLTKAGDSSAEAIKKIGKDFDLANIPGIRNAASVLDKLAADGKISATDFQNAWANALKGEDLAKFEVQARAAFAGTARETERLAQVLDATLRASIERTGLDFAIISGGMSKASISAINDTDAMINGLDRLKTMGVDTSLALTASLGKGIDTADSQKAIEAVRQQIEAVRKVLGDTVADGLLDQAAAKALELKDALDKATPGITSVREAMKELGVTSDQTFKDTAAKSAAAYQAMKDSGTASLRELADGFKKYATDAIAANGGVASETLKTEAAMRGLQITTDSTGKSIVSGMNAGAKAVDGVGKATQSATKYMDVFQRTAAEALAVLEQQNAAAERSIAAQEKAHELKQRAIDLENKRRNMDKEGWALNSAGERIVEQQETRRSIYEKAKASGLSEEQALQVANKYIAETGQQTGWYGEGAAQGKNWSVAVQEAIDKLVLENAAKTANTDSRGIPLAKNPPNDQPDHATPAKPDNTTHDPIAPVTPSPITSAKSYDVNITLGGNQTTIHTSSDADAQALIAVLQRAKLTA